MAFASSGALLAGAVIGSSLINSNAQGAAVNSAARATDSSNQLQRDLYDQTRTDNMPALDARNSSLARLQELLGIGGNSGAAGYGSLGGQINPGDVTQDPGYQFGLDQGQRVLNNQAAARGMRNSGAALLAANRYGNDYATTHYNDAFNRQLSNRNALLNPLQSLAGLGQTGANVIGQSGQNYANQVGNNMTNLANVQGQTQIGQANAITGGINQAAGWYANNQSQQANLNNQTAYQNGLVGSSQAGYTYPDPWAVGPVSGGG